MKIYLDFDGTIVEHQYPSIGKYIFECSEIIKKLYESNHKIILNTYRANCNDGTMEEAIDFLNKIQLMNYISSIQHKKIEPKSWNWNTHFEENIIFIDDICEGIPTLPTPTAEYEIVNWKELDKEFNQHKIFNKKSL